MHTARQPHTAAPLDRRTLLCALPDSHTLPRTLPHTATLPDTAVRSAAHYTNSNATHRTQHTSHRRQWHTAIFMN
jgi:hypothetical protein